MAAATSRTDLNPSVSVALCTRNGSRFLREQLRSICLQTYPPAEIIISDDASVDDTVDLTRKVLSECMLESPSRSISSRLIVNTQALNVTRNFEQAIASCGGDLVALSDQDDVWRPDKLARMVDCFVRDRQLTLLHTDARLVDTNGVSLGRSLFEVLGVTAGELRHIHAGRAFDVLLRRNLVTGATVMFRRELAILASPFPSEWLHDEWLGVVASCTGKLDVLELPLIDYRQHADNQIGARRDSLRELAAKLLASRRDTHAKRLARGERLVARLGMLGDAVAPTLKVKAHAKLAHLQNRAQLPAARRARLLPVAREAISGRYGLYNRGWRAVMRDLLESV
jgi:glycosyltransferase involved in cell wall biosynthesis